MTMKTSILEMSLRITDNSTCHSSVCWFEYLIYVNAQTECVCECAEARWNNQVWRWKKVKHLQGWCRSVSHRRTGKASRAIRSGRMPIEKVITQHLEAPAWGSTLSSPCLEEKKKNTGDWLNLAERNIVNYRSFSTISPGIAQFNCSVPHTDVATRRLGTRVSFDEHLHTTHSANTLQSRICRPAPHCLRHLHLI